MYQSDLKHSSATLHSKLRELYVLNREKTVDLSFRPPFLKLLENFGNPHLHLPPVIHVAGTNGKGSSIAMLRSVYAEAGYKVHVYTSPHLMRFNERIVLAGEQIDDQALEALIDEALDLNEGRSCTFFEITTAIAFAAFSRVPADICLLEVGMGGRLDCTNIIEAAALSLITSISMDHAEFLGDTLEKIAAEKAGIMKAGVPCVVAQQKERAVLDVVEDLAQRVGARLIHADKSAEGELGLQGAHQKENASSVLAAVEALQERFPVAEADICAGLANAIWPARLQELAPQEFNLPEGFVVRLDGGHNEDAGAAIAAYLNTLDMPVHLIFCMMKHKDPRGYLDHVIPHIDSLTVTEIPAEPLSLSVRELEGIVAPYRDKVRVYSAGNYHEAIANLGKNVQPPAMLLIAGSLYLAGYVLQDLEKIR